MATSITAALTVTPAGGPSNTKARATLTLTNTGTAGTILSVEPTAACIPLSPAAGQPNKAPVNLGSPNIHPSTSMAIAATAGTWSCSWDVIAFGAAPKNQGYAWAKYFLGANVRYLDGTTTKIISPTAIPFFMTSNPDDGEVARLKFNREDRSGYVAAL